MNKSRSTHAFLASTVVVAMLLAGCGGGDNGSGGGETSEPDAEPVSGGTLRYGLGAEVDGLNPSSGAFAPEGGLMGRAVFDTLVAVDENNEWTPRLAESLEPNEDFTKWTMTLREGVRFHDGTPLNAEAVIANFNAQRDDLLVGNALRPYYVDEEPITKVDDLTVTYNLVGSSTEWPLALSTQLGMMGSPKWLAAAQSDENLNQEPVGAGPFKFESRSQDSLTTFVRNDDYFAGAPYLDGVEFYPVTDASQRADQLLGGALDALMTTDAAQTSLVQEEEDSGAVYNILDETGEEAFIMMNTSTAPFDDIRVRQALTYATPKEAYIQRVEEGITRPANQMFNPDQPYYNADIEQITDSPELAEPLVSEYCSENAANCTDGKVNIEYQHPASAVQQRIADLLTEGWSGSFNVSISEMPQDELIQNAALGNYQVTVWRQFGAVDPYFDRVWIGCETIDVISINWPRYCSEERRQLLQDGMATDDMDTKVANMQRISEDINAAFTYVFISHQRWDNAFVSKVNGVCDAETFDGVKLRCTSNANHFLNQIWINDEL